MKTLLALAPTATLAGLPSFLMATSECSFVEAGGREVFFVEIFEVSGLATCPGTDRWVREVRPPWQNGCVNKTSLGPTRQSKMLEGEKVLKKNKGKNADQINR